MDRRRVLHTIDVLFNRSCTKYFSVSVSTVALALLQTILLLWARGIIPLAHSNSIVYYNIIVCNDADASVSTFIDKLRNELSHVFRTKLCHKLVCTAQCAVHSVQHMRMHADNGVE